MAISGPPAAPRGAYAALLAAVFAFSLLQTMVVPVLPMMRAAFDVDPETISWVLTSFLLSSSVGAVLFGRLGDLHGLRRLMLASLSLLTLGAALAALAESIFALVLARAVQGLGAATLPLAFGLAREMFDARRLTTAIGTISSMFGIGFAAGLVVPGPLTGLGGWRAVFWASAVVAVVATAAVAAMVPSTHAAARGRVDWPGVVLLSVGLSALLVAVSPGDRPSGLPLLAPAVGGAAALLGFVVVQRRVRHPLVDLGLLGDRSVALTGVVALLSGFGLFAAFGVVPELARTPTRAGVGLGADATGTGLVLLPMAATMLLAGPLAGRLGASVGFRFPLVVACVISASGFLVLSLGLDSAAVLSGGTAVLGIGVGLAFSSMANVVVDAVPAADTGQVTGVNTVLRTIGGALGAQVSTIVLTSASATTVPDAQDYTAAFTVSALALVIAALAALALPRRRSTR